MACFLLRLKTDTFLPVNAASRPSVLFKPANADRMEPELFYALQVSVVADSFHFAWYRATFVLDDDNKPLDFIADISRGGFLLVFQSVHMFTVTEEGAVRPVFEPDRGLSRSRFGLNFELERCASPCVILKLGIVWSLGLSCFFQLQEFQARQGDEAVRKLSKFRSSS